jgi:hypothetical protein
MKDRTLRTYNLGLETRHYSVLGLLPIKQRHRRISRATQMLLCSDLFLFEF